MLCIDVSEIASGSRVAVVKILPFQSVWIVRQSDAVAPKHLGNPFSQHCRRVRSVAAARRDASCDVSSARATSAPSSYTYAAQTLPWHKATQRSGARLQKNCGGRGKSQSLARHCTQRVSCRTLMSLPAMPALVPIERKTSVTQCSGEGGDGDLKQQAIPSGNRVSNFADLKGSAQINGAVQSYDAAGPGCWGRRSLRCQEYARRASTPEMR